MIPILTGLLAGIGVIQALAAAWLVSRHCRMGAADLPPNSWPSVTVLKPLHGDEPFLETALGSLCEQDYPDYQIIMGMGPGGEGALPVAERLRARYPERAIDIAVSDRVLGPNRKIGNLINMFPAARHSIIVIADSDVHVPPDYLRQLVARLLQPGVGLVTMLYAGLPAFGRIPDRLGATQITHGFLPSAVLSRALGRQDCLGATMCLRRGDLISIGGLEALLMHLADDNVLGRRIRALGLDVALAPGFVLTTVPETTLRALLRHELRWARTIRALEPAGFAASVLQYPLFWALLTVAAAWGAAWSLLLLMLVWMTRGLAAYWVDESLSAMWHDRRLAFCAPFWLLPLREVLSVCVMLISYGSRRVDWRGHALHADTPPQSSAFAAQRPTEDVRPR